MARKKSTAVYNVEQIPFSDLTKLENPDYKVLDRHSPKKEPELLNNTSWKCECKRCGKVKRISGRLLHNGSYKACECINGDSKGSDVDDVGRGLMYAMENDKSRFMEYIQTKNEESRKASCSKHIYENVTKKIKNAKPQIS